jgi:hypothetical protein
MKGRKPKRNERANREISRLFPCLKARQAERVLKKTATALMTVSGFFHGFSFLDSKRARF